MFAIHRNILKAALALALLLTSAAPAAARDGVWVYPDIGGWLSISLVNLTDYPLLITENNVEVWACYVCPDAWEQSIPFAGSGELNLAPYRTATWRSGSTTYFQLRGAYAWHRHFSLLPQGMDPKWTVTVNMHTEDASGHPGKGTWVRLAVSDDPVNTEWGPYYYLFDPPGTFFYDGWHHGVWATPMPAGSSVMSGLYNVMTASGKLLAVSLYSPDNSNLTLVVRQTHWDGSQVDDYTGWQLDFVDNNTGTMP